MTILTFEQKERPCKGAECNSVRHMYRNGFIILIRGVYREHLLLNHKYINGMRYTATITWKTTDKHGCFLVEELAKVYASTYSKAARKLFRACREHLYAIAVLVGDDRAQQYHIDRVNRERIRRNIPVLRVETSLSLCQETTNGKGK